MLLPGQEEADVLHISPETVNRAENTHKNNRYVSKYSNIN